MLSRYSQGLCHDTQHGRAAMLTQFGHRSQEADHKLTHHTSVQWSAALRSTWMQAGSATGMQHAKRGQLAVVLGRMHAEYVK